MINGGWKAYYEIESNCKFNCKLRDLWLWDKENILFETLVTIVILYEYEVWGCSTSRES
jgi:hypothetical protein